MCSHSCPDTTFTSSNECFRIHENNEDVKTPGAASSNDGANALDNDVDSIDLTDLPSPRRPLAPTTANTLKRKRPVVIDDDDDDDEDEDEEEDEDEVVDLKTC